MISLTPVDLPAERDEVVSFLSSQPWPYHATSSLNAREIAAMSFEPPETASFWVVEDGERVGLLRLQDLADIEDGSPLVDLRLTADVRGRGVGRLALGLLCDLSFARWPELRRIEGTTRDDNVAMQRVFEVCGFQREGRLRETWPTQEGRWHDTLIYGLLRRERSSLTNPADSGKEHMPDTPDDAELMVRHNRPMADTADETQVELMVRHNRPVAEPTDQDIELMVRHNRPRALEDDDVVLLVRHNRPKLDSDFELLVRHNRPMAEATTEEADLMVQHNRPVVAIDDEDTDVQLMVRHNRRFLPDGAYADEDGFEGDITLMVRHNRPMVDAAETEAPEATAEHSGTAATDVDLVLMVRHNRRLQDQDYDITLSVRHNRPISEPELLVRHNRPLA